MSATPPIPIPNLNSSTTGNVERKKLSKSFSTPANQQISGTPRVVQRPILNRSLTRTESIKQSITVNTANFFGIPAGDVDKSLTFKQKWNNRRLRHCSRRYGAVKEIPEEDTLADGATTGDFSMSAYPNIAQAAASTPSAGGLESVESGIISRSISTDSRAPRNRAYSLNRRDSVAKMAWEGLSSLVVKQPNRKRQGSVRRAGGQRSFSPRDVATDDYSYTQGVNLTPAIDLTPYSTTGTPNALGAEQVYPAMSITLPESLGRDVSDGLQVSEVPSELPSSAPPVRPTTARSSRTPHLCLKREPTIDEVSSPLENDVFFDLSPYTPLADEHTRPQSARVVTFHVNNHDEMMEGELSSHVHEYDNRRASAGPRGFPFPIVESTSASIIRRNREKKEKFFGSSEPVYFRSVSDEYGALRREIVGFDEPRAIAQALEPPEIKRKEPTFWSRLLSTALNNSNRRKFGEGVVGRFFGRTLKQRHELSPNVQEKLDSFDDYRPFFTYWVTIVQVLVLIISLASYGFGPFGFGRAQYTALVLHTSFVLEQVAYFEQENFWIGPRFADLVHLGAKYSPCMRRDRKIYEVIDQIREIENDSACCIRNDRTGCVQTTQDNCHPLLSVWNKWNGTNNPDGRTSGSVCNQDPRECKQPFSMHPHRWPDDITRWPICKETSPHPQAPHTQCELIGRPCCIGIAGECRITTREYCDFVKGYFHEEATLCSQVSCLGEVCGMLPFVSPDHPNQYYRLLTSIFLHAGLVHLLFTVLIQFILMRDLEKLIGWFRLSVIYLGSGIGGNLASAVFVPYETEVGPAGCHFGLLAALFVDAIYSWRMIVKPWKAILQLSVVLSFLFCLGLLPWVDNWAHAFGFIFGLLLSLALFPYVQFDRNDWRNRVFIVVVSLMTAIGLFCLLLSLFEFKPLWDCKNCVYFNCIPFTEHFCDNEGLSLVLLPY